MVDKHGVGADPDKTAVMREMKAPSNVPEMIRFLGMVNQQGKFLPNLAELTQPLRGLLNKKRTWL